MEFLFIYIVCVCFCLQLSNTPTLCITWTIHESLLCNRRNALNSFRALDQQTCMTQKGALFIVHAKIVGLDRMKIF